MSSIPPELRAKVKALQRDFPASSSTHILSVLLDQNQEIALARVHLALLKKEEDRIKAMKSCSQLDGSSNFESPFARAKDRPLTASLPLPPKNTHELPARYLVSQDNDLNSSTEFSSSPKSDIATSSQSSTGSSGLTRQSSFSSIPGMLIGRVQRPPTATALDIPAKYEISPLALSRPLSSTLHLQKPKEKRDITIPELLRKSTTTKKSRLLRTNLAKRKRSSSFFDDVMDLDEESKPPKEEITVVDVLDDESQAFKRRKRRKLAIDNSTHPSDSRLSQSFSRRQGSLIHDIPHHFPSPPSIESTKGVSTQSSSNASFTATSTTATSTKSTSSMSLELSWSDQEEDNDGSTTIGNDSRSSDSLASPPHHLLESDRLTLSSTATTSIHQDPFHYSSQMPREDMMRRLQMTRKNRIVEDDDC